MTDTLNAAVNGLVAGLALEGSDGGDGASGAALFGGVAALYAASAIYGYVSTAKCDSAKQNLAARIHQREAEDAQRIRMLERQLRSSRAGCSSDADCQGGRVCVSGHCKNLAPEADASPPTPARPEVGPESAPVP